MVPALALPLSTVALRAFVVPGDNMAPTLRPGDFLLAARVVDYAGEGIYVLVEPAGAMVPYRVQPDRRGGVVLVSDNPTYGRHGLSLAAFRQQVAAQTALAATVLDHPLVPAGLRVSSSPALPGPCPRSWGDALPRPHAGVFRQGRFHSGPYGNDHQGSLYLPCPCVI